VLVAAVKKSLTWSTCLVLSISYLRHRDHELVTTN